MLRTGTAARESVLTYSPPPRIISSTRGNSCICTIDTFKKIVAFLNTAESKESNFFYIIDKTMNDRFKAGIISEFQGITQSLKKTTKEAEKEMKQELLKAAYKIQENCLGHLFLEMSAFKLGCASIFFPMIDKILDGAPKDRESDLLMIKHSLEKIGADPILSQQINEMMSVRVEKYIAEIKKMILSKYDTLSEDIISLRMTSLSMTP